MKVSKPTSRYRLIPIVLALMLCITSLAYARSDAPFGVQVVRQQAELWDERIVGLLLLGGK